VITVLHSPVHYATNEKGPRRSEGLSFDQSLTGLDLDLRVEVHAER
jgi:hypothetical protein